MSKYNKKIHDLLFEKSGLDKDPYNRQLSEKVVKKFCKISKKIGIKYDDIVSDEQFDNIYRIYCNQQIKKYNK
jgi:hypothetical protein